MVIRIVALLHCSRSTAASRVFVLIMSAGSGHEDANGDLMFLGRLS